MHSIANIQAQKFTKFLCKMNIRTNVELNHYIFNRIRLRHKSEYLLFSIFLNNIELQSNFIMRI